jgi:hypothetical protein
MQNHLGIGFVWQYFFSRAELKTVEDNGIIMAYLMFDFKF